MSLDDKLREIADEYAGQVYLHSEENGLPPADPVASIKQAFADDGYVTPENAKKVQTMVNQMAQLAQDSLNMPTMVNVALDKKQQTMQNLMTGQEWYDRLLKAVDGVTVTWPNNSSKEYITAQVGIAYMEAAKRAAGIETNKKENKK